MRMHAIPIALHYHAMALLTSPRVAVDVPRISTRINPRSWLSALLVVQIRIA